MSSAKHSLSGASNTHVNNSPHSTATRMASTRTSTPGRRLTPIYNSSEQREMSLASSSSSSSSSPSSLSRSSSSASASFTRHASKQDITSTRTPAISPPSLARNVEGTRSSSTYDLQSTRSSRSVPRTTLRSNTITSEKNTKDELRLFQLKSTFSEKSQTPSPRLTKNVGEQQQPQITRLASASSSGSQCIVRMNTGKSTTSSSTSTQDGTATLVIQEEEGVKFVDDEPIAYTTRQKILERSLSQRESTTSTSTLFPSLDSPYQSSTIAPLLTHDSTSSSHSLPYPPPSYQHSNRGDTALPDPDTFENIELAERGLAGAGLELRGGKNDKKAGMQDKRKCFFWMVPRNVRKGLIWVFVVLATLGVVLIIAPVKGLYSAP